MVKTTSTMLELGTAAPDFSLPNVDGKTVSLSDFADRSGLLVIFMCNHCPFVIHLREGLAQFGTEYQAKGLGVVGINSNDVANYPDDSRNAWPKRQASRLHVSLPVRREPGGGAPVSRRLHARLLLVRRSSPIGVPRTV